MKKKLSMVLTIAAITAALAGCSGQNDTTESAAVQNQEESTKADSGEKQSDTSKEKGQVLNVSLEAEPDSLDLAKVSDTYSSTVVSQLMEGLTSIRVEENGTEKVEPAIAESWETSEDQLTWTFHLRDAQWSDGVPVKAEDFEYALKSNLLPFYTN